MDKLNIYMSAVSLFFLNDCNTTVRKHMNASKKQEMVTPHHKV